jgi:hypothetical protein
MNLVLEAWIFAFPSVRGTVFGLLLILAFIVEYYSIRDNKENINKSKLKYLKWSLGLFSIAYFIWFLDYSKLLCSPFSIFQGHAVWHVLAAIAGLLMYFYIDWGLDGNTVE